MHKRYATTIALSLFSTSLIFAAMGQSSAQAQTTDKVVQSTVVGTQPVIASDDEATTATTAASTSDQEVPTTESQSDSMTSSIAANPSQSTNSDWGQAETVGADRNHDLNVQATPSGNLQAAPAATEAVPAQTPTVEEALPTTATGSHGESASVPTTHEDSHGGIDATVDSTIDLGISNLGEASQNYDDAITTNTTLQKAASGSDQIVKTSQGNVTALYNTKSGEMVLTANNKVLTVPKFGSVNLTDDSGHVWDVYNLADGKMGVQDAVDSKIQRTANASVAESGLNVAAAGTLAAANGVNLVADAGEEVVGDAVNLAIDAGTVIAGGLAAIPLVGLVAGPIAITLNAVSSLVHGGFYAWGSARRTIVQAPAVLANVGGTVVNGMNVGLRTSNANVTGSPTDAALAGEAQRQAVGSLAGTVATTGSIALNGGLQAGTFVAHAITEGLFFAVETGLALAGMIPFVGIVTYPLAGLTFAIHKAVNAGQRLADEARRVAVLGTGATLAVAGPIINAAHSVGLNAQAQQHNNDTYTWNLK